jgi:membrane-associated phospholipid phosphatase
LLSAGLFVARIRQNIFLVVPAAYTIILLLYYAYCGVLFQYTLGVFFLAAIPITLYLGRTRNFLRELTPFIALLLSYEALQGITGTINTVPVIELVTHHNIVGAVQATLYSPLLTQATTILYGLHFPIVVALSIMLWYSDKSLFNKYMLALVISSYTSLIIYVLAPSAPPWYMGVANNLLQSNSPAPASTSLFSRILADSARIESDRLAAIPSLHAAYITLFCYFAVKVRRLYGLISIPVTAGVLFSTVYLGQHYLIDLAAGAAVAAIAILASTRITGRQTNLTSSMALLNSETSTTIK